MASGSFPVDRSSEEGKALSSAIDIIDELMGDWWEAVYTGDSGGMQFDNAASDGAYMEKMRIARNLLLQCIESHKWIVTLRFDPSPGHDPKLKVEGSCKTSHTCTDAAGAHHSKIFYSDKWHGIEEVKEAVKKQFGPTAHITRIERC